MDNIKILIREEVTSDDDDEDCTRNRITNANYSNDDDEEYVSLLPQNETPPNRRCTKDFPPVMRRFALFVDGMSRAVILPFGPSLVYRLVYSKGPINYGSIPPLEDGGVAYYFALVVSVYVVGRWFGSNFITHWFLVKYSNNRSERIPIYVARFGGAALSLHIFTYGAGLSSVRWLVAIRFVSAILAGVLCGITQPISLPEDDWVYRTVTFENDNNEERIAALRRMEGYIDIASGTAKIYLTGFAVSILSGGLLFRKASKDSTFRALTGTYQYSLSPMFLVAVAVTSEFILRKIFDWAAGSHYALSSEADHETTSERTLKKEKGLITYDTDCTNSATAFVRKRSFSTSKTAMNRSSMEEEEAEALFDQDVSRTPSSRARVDSFISAQGHGTGSTCRSRVHSANSLDEFFDCHSVLSDVEDNFVGTCIMSCSPDSCAEKFDASELNTSIPTYRNGKVIYADGSPAFVPQGDKIETVPSNYLNFYNGNEIRARQAWEATQTWRKDQNVWKITSMPNKWFHDIKQAYPHFVHGHSKSGYPVIYEQPGKMNLKHLFQSGCNVSDMIWHYTFFMEFVSNRICTRHDIRALKSELTSQGSSSWGTMVVMDVQGAGLSHLSGDVLKYLKQAGEVNSAHYPNNMKRAFVIKSPFWLAGVWSGVKGILPESVQVDILSEKNYLSSLTEYINIDQIPRDYGGFSPYKLDEHPYELELKKLVEDLNEETINNHDVNSNVQVPFPVLDLVITSESGTLFEEQSYLSAHKDPLHTANPLKSLIMNKPVRRTAHLVDRDRRLLNGLEISAKMTTGDGATTENGTRRRKEVLIIVSGIHMLFSFVQGAVEIGIPLWMLSPKTFGGLGYSPYTSGVSLFCASLVLLWTLSRKSSRLVSKVPSKEPLRAFRIGAGSESALLAILCLISPSNFSSDGKQSIVRMASTTIIFASLALGSILGRTASKILHRIAAESFSRQPKPKGGTTNMILIGLESGQFTTVLSIVAEVAGIFGAAPLWSCSISGGNKPPVNCTCILFVSSIITFLLYACSFTLHLNSAGEFVPHPKEGCHDSVLRKCLLCMCEIVAVSVGDMASLLEESNWNATPIMNGTRNRAFSDVSTSDLERGGSSRHSRKAK